MNIGGTAGKNEGIDVAKFRGKLGSAEAKGDSHSLRASGFGCAEVFVVGLAFVLKFLFSSAIRDTYTHGGAGFGGHWMFIVSFGAVTSNREDLGEKAAKIEDFWCDYAVRGVALAAGGGSFLRRCQ